MNSCMMQLFRIGLSLEEISSNITNQKKQVLITNVTSILCIVFCINVGILFDKSRWAENFAKRLTWRKRLQHSSMYYDVLKTSHRTKPSTMAPKRSREWKFSCQTSNVSRKADLRKYVSTFKCHTFK